jgi:hypothetical protein
VDVSQTSSTTPGEVPRASYEQTVEDIAQYLLDTRDIRLYLWRYYEWGPVLSFATEQGEEGFQQLALSVWTVLNQTVSPKHAYLFAHEVGLEADQARFELDDRYRLPPRPRQEDESEEGER